MSLRGYDECAEEAMPSRPRGTPASELAPQVDHRGEHILARRRFDRQGPVKEGVERLIVATRAKGRAEVDLDRGVKTMAGASRSLSDVSDCSVRRNRHP